MIFELIAVGKQKLAMSAEASVENVDIVVEPDVATTQETKEALPESSDTTTENNTPEPTAANPEEDEEEVKNDL